MGCLNDSGQFSHWFGNIHLSGPCNRACYFCIGQHMMALDPYNNLGVWPPDGIDEFIYRCQGRHVREVFLTGTNTEPLLYEHHAQLTHYLRWCLPAGCQLGIRSNGAVSLYYLGALQYYDKISITVCATDPETNRAMMGGPPPALVEILKISANRDLKVNIVLGPENVAEGPGHVFNTLTDLKALGVKRANLREPYGQPLVGDPFARAGMPASRSTLGMPTYDCNGIEVTYWDVHYVEVQSVNLYANGRVSETYPITKGHHPTGVVRPQSEFPGGRIQAQWLGKKVGK